MNTEGTIPERFRELVKGSPGGNAGTSPKNGREMMEKIAVEHLDFTYKDSGQRVLKDFSLRVEEGEFLCVIGRSGCGKSTLLRLLAGLERPQRGRILLDGRELGGPDTDRAVVFQQDPLFPWMTVRKNVVFAAAKSGRFTKQEAAERAEYFLEKTGMSAEGKKYPCQLSGGMRQRTALARALAMDSEVLLLDEPFGALDNRIRAELQQLIRDLWADSCRGAGDGIAGSAGKRKTAVFVTHDLEEALILATRIVFIRDGAVDRELSVSERINRCCAQSLNLADCLELKASLAEWFQ
ncbi:ABC transporter ATP-binding protein [Bacilliculturomica massiliensis]|uniref:ABC transporter ATP-binding protein n=1 Tax=Bacilliculturomica massiliensis TaxID=1917867 RepID=UPI0010312987|nr:ABC transporter ATP-binding protein [Bacilliculturomica massiliensis]